MFVALVACAAITTRQLEQRIYAEPYLGASAVSTLVHAPFRLLAFPFRLSQRVLRVANGPTPSSVTSSAEYVYAKLSGNSSVYHICRRLPEDAEEGLKNGEVAVDCGGVLHHVPEWNVRQAGPEMPLLVAASTGDVRAANRTLRKGCPIDGSDPHGRTALYCAACEGSASMIKLLLNAGADVDKAQEQNATPLFVTCQMGHEEAADELISSGADLRVATKLGATPLHVASQYGHETLVKRLLNAGANPNELLPKGVTPLYVAAQMGHSSIVRDLLAAGASASYPIPSVNGATALFAAAQRGHTEVVKILAGEVANVDQGTTDSNVTPLLVAAEMGSAPVVSMLISHGANVDGSSKEGCTPLSQACIHGHYDVAKELLDAGADPNVVMATPDGPAPLYWAAKHGHLDIVKLLIKEGADLDRTTKRSGKTALQAATQAGHTEVARILMEAGALTQQALSGQVTRHSGGSSLTSRAYNRNERMTAPETAKFNVGGQIFEISVNVLKRHPRCLLTSLSGQSENGEPIFVDRSADRFTFVLDWLRDEHVTVPPSVSREALMRDLAFFNLKVPPQSVVYEAPALGVVAKRQGEMLQRFTRTLDAKLSTLKRQSAVLESCKQILNCTVLEMNKGVTQITFTPEQGGCLSAVSDYTSDVEIRQSITQMLREAGIFSEWVWSPFTWASTGWTLRVDSTKQVLPDTIRKSTRSMQANTLDTQKAIQGHLMRNRR